MPDMQLAPDSIRNSAWAPDWPMPAGVRALMSTRELDVRAQPERWAAILGVATPWLRQVHGTEVAVLGPTWPQGGITADAAVTTQVGVACSVMVADCLPVLLSTRDGRGVGAAHAGWRGLAAGVLEATVAALQSETGAEGSDITAWLGPCIGPDVFEVGGDVLEAFGFDPRQQELKPDERFWRFRPRPDGSPRWLGNLPALARQRLRNVGLLHVHGGQGCTFSEASRFFSFRRDGSTGRMAASIWRQG